MGKFAIGTKKKASIKGQSKIHIYSVGTIVRFKWDGKKDSGPVLKHTFNSEGTPTYTVKSTKTPGCRYPDMAVDDPNDKWCFISSSLTDSN